MKYTLIALLLFVGLTGCGTAAQQLKAHEVGQDALNDAQRGQEQENAIHQPGLEKRK